MSSLLKVEGTMANLTVGRLEPNTSYTCQGGMLVAGGDWLYSPKALRMTQNSSASTSVNYSLLALFFANIVNFCPSYDSITMNKNII